MRHYLIDDLTSGDVERLRDGLAGKGYAGSLEDLFWLPLPEDLLGDEQREHAAECGPFALALECGESWARLELLVRSRSRIRCSCVAYATPAQREAMLDRLDALLAEFGIRV